METIDRSGSDSGNAAPVAQSDRIVELDMLRGFALFGVLLMNFLGVTRPDGEFVQAQQLAALSTAGLDRVVAMVSMTLLMDKANTLFATLFGLGFYLQMQRSQGRPGFERRYLKRLTWLLIFGWLNLTLLWFWDILNLYALGGFLLLAMRNWKTRSLVAFGLVAALLRDTAQEWIVGALGFSQGEAISYTESAIAARQAVVLHGSYFDNVAMMFDLTVREWIVGGLILGWLVYALGRFALGAAIGRSGILADIPGHLPLLCKVAAIAIPVGLAVSIVEVSLMFGLFGERWEDTGSALAPAAALVLSAGYAAGLVVAWHAGRGRWLLAQLVPVGQMALTTYLMQGLLYGFVLFGIGPGLGLMGKLGATMGAVICIAFFAGQIAFSHWWLARYRFGPMEWLWRTLTYGARPAMRRERAGMVAAA